MNEVSGGPGTGAHLLEFDSVHGRWDDDIGATDDGLSIAGTTLGWTDAREPAGIDWAAAGVDLVLECSGRFRSGPTLAPHLERGARKVVVAAPVKDGSALNVVVGVNDDRYDPDVTRHRHGRLVHDELPGPGREGDPRGDRDQPRLDHDPPRPHQHPDDRRRAAQGPAPRTGRRACR